MEQELFQIGAIGVLSIVLIREGVNLIKWILSKKNGKNGNGISKTDNQQAIDIAVLKEKVLNYEVNHFPSIEKRFDKIDNRLDSIERKIDNLK